MTLPSNLTYLTGINKLWMFEVEGPKWQNWHYHTLSVVDTDIPPPGCAGPPDPNRMTAYLDSAAFVSVLGAAAAAKLAQIQKPNFALNTPSHMPIYTSKTLELHLKKLPQKVREAF